MAFTLPTNMIRKSNKKVFQKKISNFQKIMATLNFYNDITLNTNDSKLEFLTFTNRLADYKMSNLISIILVLDVSLILVLPPVELKLVRVSILVGIV